MTLTRNERPGRVESTGVQPVSADGSQEAIGGLREALADRHRALGSVGRGGMAEVDLVLDVPLDRTVVRKRMHPELEADAQSVAMFIREARIVGRLEHPNIVPVHELGLVDDQSPFFTMKRVEGRTLREVVLSTPEGPMARDTMLDAIDIVVRVADALSFAHSHGVIHLDVKPENVMVGDYGQVYLMDWGVARSTTDVHRGPPSLIGTPSYMAPEQARGAMNQLGEATDVFALGALLYFVLARTPPYSGENIWQVVVRAQRGEAVDLSVAAPWAPASLVRIVRSAMATEPAERPASAAALRAQLIGFVRGADVFQPLAVPAGEVLIREGDDGDTAYQVASGRLEVSRVEDGRRVAIREMGPGEVFGEMAILAPGPRTATVSAIEDSVVRVITALDLEREVAVQKPWLRTFIRSLAQRFREREAARTAPAER